MQPRKTNGKPKKFFGTDSFFSKSVTPESKLVASAFDNPAYIQFIQAVIDDDFETVSKMLDNNLDFLLNEQQKNQSVQSKNTLQKIKIENPLAMAFKRGQNEMVKLLLSYFGKIKNGAEFAKALMMSCPSTIKDYDFYDMLNILKIDLFTSATEQDRLIDNAKPETKSAIQEFRKAMLPDDVITLDDYYHIEDILFTALKVDQDDIGFLDMDQWRYFSIAVIGFLQSLLPPELAMKLSLGKDELSKVNEGSQVNPGAVLRSNETPFYRSSPDSMSGMGFDYMYTSKGESGERASRECFEFFKNLLQERKIELNKIIENPERYFHRKGLNGLNLQISEALSRRDSTVSKWRGRGDKKLNNQNFLGALRDYEAALNMSPNDRKLLKRACGAAHQHAILLSPHDETILEALDFFDKASQFALKRNDYKILQTICYDIASCYAKAIHQHLNNMKLNQVYVKSLMNMGNIFCHEGNFDQAFQYFKNAQQLAWEPSTKYFAERKMCEVDLLNMANGDNTSPTDVAVCGKLIKILNGEKESEVIDQNDLDYVMSHEILRKFHESVKKIISKDDVYKTENPYTLAHQLRRSSSSSSQSNSRRRILPSKDSESGSGKYSKRHF